MTASSSPPTFFAAVLGLALMAAASLTVRSAELRLAISGYDPVAYFTDGDPTPGKPEFDYEWHHSLWLFADAQHRALFVADPERYAPQYDGYCSMGVAGVSFAAPHKDTVDPEAWAIVDGKLYLTHTTRSMDRWRQDASENIKRADVNWSNVQNQPEPAIIGPPCPDHPPSVVVSVSGGDRRVLVGGQVAIGKDGNVVGKGDMRAQTEQVGKNIQACLQAAGAKVSDIILTRAYVTDAEAFSKNADILARYLGSASAPSSVAQVSLSAGPDFLVEIEAVATVESPAAASADRKP